jgi:hypothetical protein
MDQEEQLHNSSSFVDPRSMGALYNTQGYRKSPVTHAFFSVTNLTQLIRNIDDEVSNQAGFPVSIVPDDVFYLTACKHADAVPNTVYVDIGVRNLNAIMFNEQVPLHMHQIQRRKLYFKYYIMEDRAKYMPRSRMTWGRNRVNPLTTEDYTMKDPDSKDWGNFQQQMNKQKTTVKMPSLFNIYFDDAPEECSR